MTAGGPPPASPDAAAPRDPGAQPERTRLAWRRTSLTFVVCMGLVVRTVVVGSDGPLTTTAAAGGVLAWLGFLAVAHRRISSMEAARPGAMSVGVVRAAALCTLTMVIVGAALAF